MKLFCFENETILSINNICRLPAVSFLGLPSFIMLHHVMLQLCKLVVDRAGRAMEKENVVAYLMRKYIGAPGWP